jgi:hypothetical protein
MEWNMRRATKGCLQSPVSKLQKGEEVKHHLAFSRMGGEGKKNTIKSTFFDTLLSIYQFDFVLERFIEIFRRNE